MLPFRHRNFFTLPMQLRIQLFLVLLVLLLCQRAPCQPFSRTLSLTGALPLLFLCSSLALPLPFARPLLSTRTLSLLLLIVASRITGRNSFTYSRRRDLHFRCLWSLAYSPYRPTSGIFSYTRVSIMQSFKLLLNLELQTSWPLKFLDFKFL